MVKEIRKDETGPILLVDAGNLLFKRQAVPAEAFRDKLIAAGIMEVYSTIGYDAVAVGPYDLAAGVNFLKSSPRTFPWISANLVDSSNSTVFPPFIVKDTGAAKIGIIGLTGRIESLPAEVHIADWHTVLPATLSLLAKKCDHIVLLSNLSQKDNNEIAAAYPEIRIIVAADRQFGNMSPTLQKYTLMTQTAAEGKYLGVLAVDWGTGNGWGPNHKLQLKELNRQSANIDRKIDLLTNASDSPGNSLQRQQLENARREIRGQIVTLNEEVRKFKKIEQSPSTFDSRIIALNSSISDDIGIQKILDRSKQQINGYQPPPAAVEPPRSNTTTELPPTGSLFTGREQCMTCHGPQSDFWQATAHAKAYSDLVVAGQSRNPACLACHVTRDLQSSLENAASQEALLSLGPSLQTVGCETCHGPGAAHSKNPSKSNIVGRPEQQVCLACHTKERDPGFNFPKKIALIGCPQNGN